MKIDIDIKNLPSDSSVCHQMIIDLLEEAQKVKQLEEKNALLENQNSLLQNKSLILEDKNLILQNQNSTLQDEKDILQDYITVLESQLALLKAKRFGKSSEKLNKEELDQKISEIESRLEDAETENPNEDDDEKEEEETQEVKLDNKQKKKPKRQKLPEHLSREEVVLGLDVCPECGGKDLRKISDDISEVLEYVPSSFKVMRYVRPRCACVICEKIVQAYPISNPISKGTAGPGLLAHILVQKYGNHLPLYRQSQIYEREGIHLSRSTMASWMGRCARLLEPLIDELKKYVFSSSHIHGDDTTVRVLAPGLGKTKIGRIWTYVRDGRPYGDTTPPAAVYFYSPDRKGERPQTHLKDFKGILHADAYSGYDKVYEKEVTEAACWAHTRRKFYEITVVSSNAKISCEVLEKIAEIYKIEEEIKGLEPDKRLKIRQKRSKGLLDDLFEYFKAALKKLPNRSATTLAINYAMNNQVALTRFLDDGKVEVDKSIASYYTSCELPGIGEIISQPEVILCSPIAA